MSSERDEVKTSAAEAPLDLSALLASSPTLLAALEAERAAFEAERATWSERLQALELERDHLRAAHERLRQELELWKRRIFIAKAERVDTEQLQLEFAQKLKQLETIAGTLGLGKDGSKKPTDDARARDGKLRGKREHNGGTGRRDLRLLPLEEERVEITDPHLEELVLQGKVVRHGFEESCKLGYRRGGMRRVVIARVRYKTVDAEGNTDVITTPMPEQALPSALATPSLLSHVVMENIGKGLPLFRIEDSFEREGVVIDRGTLSRWKNTGSTRIRVGQILVDGRSDPLGFKLKVGRAGQREVAPKLERRELAWRDEGTEVDPKFVLVAWLRRRQLVEGRFR